MTRASQTRCVAAGILVLWTTAAAALADKPKDTPADDRPADRDAIRQRVKDFLKAAAAGDAAAVAAFWTPTGEYVHADELTLRGRANIEKAYKEFFDKKKALGTVEPQGVATRFLGDDTALMEGTFLVKRGNPAEQSRNCFSILFVRSRDVWSIAQMKETPEGPSVQDLAWLLGTWTYQGDKGTEAEMTFDWMGDKAFLRGQLKLKRGEESLTSTLIIGRDPETGELRSWTFEGDGGIGEAFWERTEKGWTYSAKTVTADGEKVQGRTTLTPVDANAFEWKLTDRMVGDEKLPDVGPVKVTRKGS